MSIPESEEAVNLALIIGLAREVIALVTDPKVIEAGVNVAEAVKKTAELVRSIGDDEVAPPDRAAFDLVNERLNELEARLNRDPG